MISSSRIRGILHSLEQLSETIRVHGASSPARALILARLCVERTSPILVICPDDESAQDLAGDVETLGRTVLGKEIDSLLLPTWEQSLYSSITPSLKTRFSRIATLSRLSTLR